jgi:hypothetical protein
MQLLDVLATQRGDPAPAAPDIFTPSKLTGPVDSYPIVPNLL